LQLDINQLRSRISGAPSTFRRSAGANPAVTVPKVDRPAKTDREVEVTGPSCGKWTRRIIDVSVADGV